MPVTLVRQYSRGELRRKLQRREDTTEVFREFWGVRELGEQCARRAWGRGRRGDWASRRVCPMFLERRCAQGLLPCRYEWFGAGSAHLGKKR